MADADDLPTDPSDDWPSTGEDLSAGELAGLDRPLDPWELERLADNMEDEATRLGLPRLTRRPRTSAEREAQAFALDRLQAESEITDLAARLRDALADRPDFDAITAMLRHPSNETPRDDRPVRDHDGEDDDPVAAMLRDVESASWPSRRRCRHRRRPQR